MSRKVRLRDGTLVVIRPMTRNDADRSFAFFESLSPEDKAYLRRDVSQKEVVVERIRAMRSGNVKRMVALVDDRIVADAALELEPLAWKKHVAELRLIVASGYQRKGLGISILGVADRFIGLSGTLDDPKVVLNPTSAAAFGAAAWATGGLSLLADSIWTRMTAFSNPCEHVEKSFEK